MHLVRRVSNAILGRDPEDPEASNELEAAGVPVAFDSCRYCADPCDEGEQTLLRNPPHIHATAN